jgi:aconitate hydratase
MKSIDAMPTLEIRARDRAFRAIDLRSIAASHGADLDAMPYVIRVLFENLWRHRLWSGAQTVGDAELEAIGNWRKCVGSELPLHVARVILPDSSGVPVLQDLAALRDAVARAGRNPQDVDVRLPLHLIVDHSLQIDTWGSPDSFLANLRHEFSRNDERYRFIKWAQQAFDSLRVFPPGTGIIHQVNLENIAQVIATAERDGSTWAFPDFVIGGDSHTPMVNALGVLGWGVGGIDAEVALLGRAYTFPVPEVVGVRLHGAKPAGAFTTDVALRVTEILRGKGVVNRAVEFFGPVIGELTVPERATLSNMAPEYGATCAFFPVDGRTLDYLRMTGRDPAHVALVEAYCRRDALFRDPGAASPDYAEVIDIDLSRAGPSMAGPRRPQDRLDLQAIAGDFRRRLAQPAKDGGFAAEPAADVSAGSMPAHGAIVIAAITSCTNTSNPEVMLAAGLVAKKAALRGLQPPPWVKTSLAPGSRAVTRYLEAAGLLAPLAALGFHVDGYGCTTCGGKSGPLDPAVAEAIEQNGSVAAAVLSGNRNFEGRIHKLVRANYIGAPPFVVLYALAGRIDVDLTSEALAVDPNGAPVYMRDLLPAPDEVRAAMKHAEQASIFTQRDDAFDPAVETWRAIEAPSGPRFAWDARSRYLVEPPFFTQARGEPAKFRNARALAAFGDSLTTDHISPGGEIPLDTPAGRYLSEQKIAQKDFNTYVSRRGNYHVMARATFANIRVRNALTPEVEGGFTKHYPDGEVMTIFEAAGRYQDEGVPTIVLGGRDYGSGSSRDWAAKGTALLGVVAVLAESFERIHRANLVGMGVVPLRFRGGEGWRQLGLGGDEAFTLHGVDEAVASGGAVRVTATRPSGERLEFEVTPEVLTASERRLMAEGGIPRSVLREFTHS